MGFWKKIGWSVLSKCSSARKYMRLVAVASVTKSDSPFDTAFRNIAGGAVYAYSCSPPFALPNPPKYCGLRLAVSNVPTVIAIAASSTR